ncbi:hypothetical protein [Formosimonas limnophila]|nr:hypothetical protein [Formosimonas limnophila]
MFTRTSFATVDMAHQGKILSEVAQLVEVNKLRSTITQDFGTINAANIWQADRAPKRVQKPMKTSRTI